MERDFARAQLSEADYLRLAALFRGDPKFPANYLGWLSLVAVSTHKTQEEGGATADLVVDVDDFVAWCNRVAVHLCFDSLRAYLIVTRRARDLGARAEGCARQNGAGRSPTNLRGGKSKRATLENSGRRFAHLPSRAFLGSCERQQPAFEMRPAN